MARGPHLILAMPAGEQYSIHNSQFHREAAILFLEMANDVVVDRARYPGIKSSADADILV